MKRKGHSVADKAFGTEGGETKIETMLKKEVMKARTGPEMGKGRIRSGK
jgi:hypothetical protein